MNPLQSGGAAITGAALGNVIVWLAPMMHMTPPPNEVAGTLGALVLVAAHGTWVWLCTPKTTTPTPPPQGPST